MPLPITKVATPVLPQAAGEYNRIYQDQYNNILRLFFTRLLASFNLLIDRVESPEIVSFTPTAEPVSPSEGDVYFDSTTKKLRCYDGTVWQDLF